MRLLSSKLFAAAACVAAVSAQTCYDYVLVATRGTSELQGPSVGFIGMINQTLSTLPNGITYNVVYPAAPNQTAYLGGNDIVRYINAGVAACPSQKYAVLGYSQGARASALGLFNITTASPAYPLIKAVVVVGNPVRVAGSSANVDENGGTSNRNNPGRVATVSGSAAVPFPDSYYSDGKILDICYSRDYVCDATTGTASENVIAHLLYTGNTNVQRQGAQFLIAKLSGRPVVGGNGTYPSGNLTTGPSGTATGTPRPTGTGTGPSATAIPPSRGLGFSTGPSLLSTVCMAAVAGVVAMSMSL